MKKKLVILLLFSSSVLSQQIDTLKLVSGCYFIDSLMSERIVITRNVRIDSFIVDKNPITHILPKPLEDFTLYINRIKYDQLQLQFYGGSYWNSILEFVIDENGNVDSLYVRDSLVLHYDDEIIKKEFPKIKFTPCKFGNKNVSVKARLYITSYPKISEYSPNSQVLENDFGDNEVMLLNIPFIAEKYSIGNGRKKEAREDISKGYILIINGGWFGVGEKVDSIAQTFGFNFIRSGCSAVEGDEYYNEEVIKYLSRRNGDGWWKRFLEEVSKLNLDEIPSLPTIKEN